jgi:hypothetical protein
MCAKAGGGLNRRNMWVSGRLELHTVRPSCLSLRQDWYQCVGRYPSNGMILRVHQSPGVMAQCNQHRSTPLRPLEAHHSGWLEEQITPTVSQSLIWNPLETRSQCVWPYE